jgi:hypothetical protein
MIATSAQDLADFLAYKGSQNYFRPKHFRSNSVIFGLIYGRRLGK